MNAQDLIATIESEGLRLALDAAGNLRCHGDKAKAAAFLPKLKAHRPELVAVLSTRALAPTDPTPTPDATPDDLARADAIRQRMWAGQVLYLGQWHGPDDWKAAQAAQQPEPLPTPCPATDQSATSTTEAPQC
jgi:hypothetical protein